MSDYQHADKGDIFDAPGGIVRVTRRSLAHGWVDIVVIQPGGAVWTKRMPKGIPASWRKLPRR